jgi:Fe-S-cluster-containing dehydrogenase component
MKVSRREFLKLAGAAGAASLAGGPGNARAARLRVNTGETRAMLVDTTRCAGCRACEAACSESNRLPQPVLPGNNSVFEKKRLTDSRTYTVVNRYENPTRGGAPIFVKSQCMHCVEPACASACPVKALEKTPEGPVVYHKDRCIGCRYCMVACPFRVPKYEYEKTVPYVRKCAFCIGRLQQGKAPACASVCPSGGLQWGKRKDLLEVARTRIYQNPDRYVHHIYGEHEAGGTGWLYISGVPFEKLGFPMDVGTRPYSELTQGSLSAVPLILTLWPPLLMGLYTFTRNREEAPQALPGDEKEARHE